METFLGCQKQVMQMLYYWVKKKNQVRNFIKDDVNSTE